MRTKNRLRRQLETTVFERDDRRRISETARGLIRDPTIFADTATGRTLGDESFDAFVFWPRTQLTDGRPDWLEKVLGRRPVAVPQSLTGGSGLRLVQAFRSDEPVTAIPVDQILLSAAYGTSVLMLPPGSYRLRTLDRTGAIIGETRIEVG